ncbi:DUF11 domain-containing protein, partial [Ruegeria lacuscaerulensis]|uniref:DUF7507 domain-containing protein n=1 Tax=Ruegeria lacuscaerulensis TaxID=55218 RepID=UPI0014808110
MADFNLEAEGSRETIGGVTFINSPNQGSGTGNFEPFLATSDEASTSDGVAAGFNTVNDSNSAINNAFGNNELDKQKTREVKLTDIPVTVIDGVEYYEIRLDLNESNSDDLITLETFQIYLSDDGTIGTYNDLTSNGNLVYDIDAIEPTTLFLAETSTGSGTDDYTVLIEKSVIDAYFLANPSESFEDYYFYLYSEMGRPGEYDEEAGFDEWNIQSAGTINGFKFGDLDGDGVYEPEDGESGLEGVVVYIDSNNNGIFDADTERATVTDENGNFTFFGVATSSDDIIIREDISSLEAGSEPTNGTLDGQGDDPYFWVANLSEAGDTDFVQIGNLVPNPQIMITKTVVDVDGEGSEGIAEDAGDEITYQLVIENTGNLALAGVTVTDPLTGVNILVGDLEVGEVVTIDDGDSDGLGGTVDLTYQVTQEDLDSRGDAEFGDVSDDDDGNIENTASVSGFYEEEEVSDSAQQPIAYQPGIEIEKEITSVDDLNGNGLVDAGDQINYSITVTNTGNVTLTDVDVEDPLLGGTLASGETIAVGGEETYTGSYTITQADVDSQG